MKLLHSDTSPFGRKVRIVAAEKKLELEIVPVDPWQPNALLQAANPLNQVPTLLLDDGSSLFDSRVIVEYLDGLSPVHRLIPEDTRQRIQAKRWMVLGDGICEAALSARIEGNRPDQTDSGARHINRQLGKVEAALTEIATLLGEREYCQGTAYSMADIAVGCALGYLKFRFPQLTWEQQHPNLARLYKRLAARSAFVSTEPAPIAK